MKTSVKPWFSLLAVLAGLHSVAAQPALSIAPAGDQSLIYWPAIPNTNITIMQAATNLASPNWVTADDAVPVTANTVSNTSPARFFRLIYTNPPAGMALIPAGSFIIGDTLDGESDAIPANVYVSGFYMDVNLVSYGLWTNVYAYATGHGYGFDGIGFADAGAGANNATNQPVQTVDWYDCVKWCNARSQLAGLTPVYYTDAVQVYKTGEIEPHVNLLANGFRLPTEAEWEKAARGGLSGRRFPWGNRIDGNQANYVGDTNSYSYDLGPDGANATGSIGGVQSATSPVGSFDVNGYGLYDMAGNVFEWCWDWYGGTPYTAGSPYLGGSNPQGADPVLHYRVLRGGFWGGYASSARCACRNLGYPSDVVSVYIGFRCVRRP